MTVLIIILSILFGIPLLIFLLLCIPVGFYVRYDTDGLFVSIRYLFIKKAILDTNEEENSQKEDVVEEIEKEVVKEENKIIALLNKKGLQNLFDIFKEILKLAFGTLKKVFAKIRLKYLNIDINVSSENASDTAIKYGQTCAVVYPFVSVFTQVVKCKKQNANIGLDYKRESDIINVELKGSIIPLFVVIHGLGFVIKALPYFKKLK